MKNHSAEAVGLAGFVLLGPILNELERLSPGAKLRVLEDAKASVVQAIHTQQGAQGGAILAVLDDMILS